jgi:hypothetical protein
MDHTCPLHYLPEELIAQICDRLWGIAPAAVGALAKTDRRLRAQAQANLRRRARRLPLPCHAPIEYQNTTGALKTQVPDFCTWQLPDLTVTYSYGHLCKTLRCVAHLGPAKGCWSLAREVLEDHDATVATTFLGKRAQVIYKTVGRPIIYSTVTLALDTEPHDRPIPVLKGYARSNLVVEGRTIFIPHLTGHDPASEMARKELCEMRAHIVAHYPNQCKVDDCYWHAASLMAAAWPTRQARDDLQDLDLEPDRYWCLSNHTEQELSAQALVTFHHQLDDFVSYHPDCKVRITETDTKPRGIV